MCSLSFFGAQGNVLEEFDCSDKAPLPRRRDVQQELSPSVSEHKRVDEDLFGADCKLK